MRSTLRTLRDSARRVDSEVSKDFSSCDCVSSVQEMMHEMADAYLLNAAVEESDVLAC